MKRVLVFVFFTAFLVSGCNFVNRNKKETVASETQIGLGRLVFERDTHEFGDVLQGEEVACRFVFVNEGDEPVLIQEVKAGCGCTNIKYPMKPIQPGYRGSVEVTFNTRGRQGFQRQSVLVVSNTADSPVRLSITANVK